MVGRGAGRIDGWKPERDPIDRRASTILAFLAAAARGALSLGVSHAEGRDG
jgi:hypothetical protein